MNAVASLLLKKLFIAVASGHGSFAPFLAMFQDLSDYQDSSEPATWPIVVVVVLANLAVITPFVVITVRWIKYSRENSRILQTGEAAQARILRIWETGTTVNNNPQIGMLIEVAPAGRPVYQAEIKSLVSLLQIQHVQPEATVQVKFDRENPLRVVLAI